MDVALEDVLTRRWIRALSAASVEVKLKRAASTDEPSLNIKSPMVSKWSPGTCSAQTEREREREREREGESKERKR